MFSYNRTNVTNEWVNGFYVQIDKKTAFSYYNSYDTLNNKTYENYFTLYRNLHCWTAYLQYQSVAKTMDSGDDSHPVLIRMPFANFS